MAIDIDKPPPPENEWPDTISGPIGERWKQLGGQTWGRPAHLPKEMEGGRFRVCTFKRPGGAFMKIVWSASTGARVMNAAYWQRWWHEAVRNVVGLPTTDVALTHDGVGGYQNFQGGLMVSHPQTGVHELHGDILARYGQLGGSRFGYPTTDEARMSDGRGRFNHFKEMPGGAAKAIHWTPTTGAHEISGAIAARWDALNFIHGVLRYPTSGELVAHDGVGRYQRFEGGLIVWHPQTGAHEVHGVILARYGELGGSQFGYPTTDEETHGPYWNRGRRNHFRDVATGADKTILWKDGATQARELTGPFRDQYAALGWNENPMGFPLGSVTAWPDGGEGSQQQAFQFGRIVRRGSDGRTSALTSPVDCSLDVSPSSVAPGQPVTITLRGAAHFWHIGSHIEVQRKGQVVAAYDAPYRDPYPVTASSTFVQKHTFTEADEYVIEGTVRGVGSTWEKTDRQTTTVTVGAPIPTPIPDQPSKPDLRFVGPARLSQDSTKIEVDFTNAGASASAFRVGGAIDNVPVNEVVYQGMAAGQGDTVLLTPGAGLTAGAHAYRFVLDLYSTVSEVNEEDNAVHGWFTVG